MVAVVVGASVAGARAVQSLRRRGYPGRIVLMGEETAAPYDRPPLSKGMLSGVLCDSGCRVLGWPDIYAAGHVARWAHPRHGHQVRIEYWTNAVEQAEHVARMVLDPGTAREYAPVEYVRTEQYGRKIQVTGRPGGHPVVVTDGGARLGVLYGDDQEQHAGAVTADWPRAMLAARSVLAEGGRVGTAHDRWLELAGRARPLTAGKIHTYDSTKFEESAP